jgi:hypothetical protein
MLKGKVKLTGKSPILAVEPVYYTLLACDLLSNLVTQRSLRLGKVLAKIFNRSSIRFGLFTSFFAKF